MPSILMDISYFSGKMEGYPRYKEIPHTRHYVKWGEMSGKILANTGHMRVRAIETAGGDWLQDSTPMIEWFEARHPAYSVLPEDPCQAFFCRLLEDYADEWLWRPVLHYRWSFEEDARNLSEHFARTFFLLGGKPSLADFGFFASMFRHFSQDPTPSRIMQERAPGVHEWIARMWDARGSKLEKKKVHQRGNTAEDLGTHPAGHRRGLSALSGGKSDCLAAAAKALRFHRAGRALQETAYGAIPCPVPRAATRAFQRASRGCEACGRKDSARSRLPGAASAWRARRLATSRTNNPAGVPLAQGGPRRAPSPLFYRDRVESARRLEVRTQ